MQSYVDYLLRRPGTFSTKTTVVDTVTVDIGNESKRAFTKTNMNVKYIYRWKRSTVILTAGVHFNANKMCNLCVQVNSRLLTIKFTLDQLPNQTSPTSTKRLPKKLNSFMLSSPLSEAGQSHASKHKLWSDGFERFSRPIFVILNWISDQVCTIQIVLFTQVFLDKKLT